MTKHAHAALLNMSREGLVQILETIDEGIHAVNLEGTTVLYNQAASRLDGLRPQDVIGKHVLEAFPSLEHTTSTLIQVLESGTPIYNVPQTYTNYLGLKVHTVNTTLPILSEDRVVGALEIAKDLTQVKKLADQVVRLQAQANTSGTSRILSRLPGSGRHHSTAVYQFSHILTNHPPLQELKVRAERSARTTSPILIYGETGTGKELLVQSIHNASPRKSGSFLALNCAALPASLLEGILFGTVKGSFTGAENRAGLFELADGGTLFLDEIQSMPLELQAKLLRALQEGEVMRVGDVQTRKVDVRIITAMNEVPERAVRNGLLRPDLYYRINVVRFDLPPLRERYADLDLLTHHFIGKWNGKFGAHVTGVDAQVREVLRLYPWPGNVRELENAIEAAMNLVTAGLIYVGALPPHIRETMRRLSSQGDMDTLSGESLDVLEGPPLPGRAENSAERPSHGVSDDDVGWYSALRDLGLGHFWAEVAARPAEAVGTETSTWRGIQAGFERIVLEHTLTAHNWNVKRVASVLQIPRQTLQYRMKQLDLHAAKE